MNEHQVATPVLIAGLEAAIVRFVNCTPGTDEAFHAIFEALAWIGTIRDRFRADGFERPDIFEGHYYMRNVVLHQGADVLDWLLIPGSVGLGSGSLGSIMFGGGTQTLKSWHWPLAGEFKAPESKAGRKQYESMLQGMSVADTLGNAARELRDVWAQSGHSEEAADS